MMYTSTLLTQAINYAKGLPNLSQELNQADNDNNYYILETGCKLLSVGNPPNFFLTVIFIYAASDQANQPLRFMVDLAVTAAGGFQVLPQQNLAPGDLQQPEIV
jgi:hypothetical protein